jgi:hypothetical protein
VKLSEIKVTAGKDAIVFSPKAVMFVFAGKAGSLDQRMAEALWKAVALPAEKICTEIERQSKE